MDPQALIDEAIQASKNQPLVVDNEKDDYFRPNLNGWLAKAAAAGYRMFELLEDQKMSALKASIFFGKCKKLVGNHQIEVENPSDEQVVGWLIGGLLDGVNDRKYTYIDLAGNVSWSPLFAKWKYGWKKMKEGENPPSIKTFTGGSNPPVIPSQYGSKREQRVNDLGWDPLPDSFDENW
jgi:hypothetical protein